MMVKYKKIISVILMGLLCLVLMPVSYGDMGPKPTTDVEIIGLDEPYYFDLLAYYDEEDVIVLDDNQIIERIDYDYYLDDFPSVLNGYRDEDGFGSYTLYSFAPHTIRQNDNVYHCGYYMPPDVFKIVLVLESGDMIVSDIIEKELFAAYITFDLSDFSITQSDSEAYNDIMIYYPGDLAEESIPVGAVIIQVVVTVVLTILVEGLILFAFGYRSKKSFLLILYVNLATQVLLYLAIDISYLYANFFGFFGALFLGEAVVFIAEAILYGTLLKEHSKTKAVIYAIVANLVSLVGGILSAMFLLSLMI